MSWQNTLISEDGTHHVWKKTNTPVYEKKFISVEKFHEPGLAPVLDESGAYHITITGKPAYEQRFLKTFGFYFNRAAVITNDGWAHIKPDGSFAYDKKYAWVGNYQDDVCVVRDFNNRYFHIDLNGNELYPQKYIYAGDFKDGIAVVRIDAFKCTHIDKKGKMIHNKFFLDLDIYHKGYARARDEQGWFHIDKQGNPAYSARFANVEPFYNGFSYSETFDGSKVIINEKGDIILTISRP